VYVQKHHNCRKLFEVGILTLNYSTSTISFDGRSKSEKLDDVKAALKGTKNDFIVIADHPALQKYPIVRVFYRVVTLIAIVSMTEMMKKKKKLRITKCNSVGAAYAGGEAGATMVNDPNDLCDAVGGGAGAATISNISRTKQSVNARKVLECEAALVVIF
jgi:hypothetical protein